MSRIVRGDSEAVHKVRAEPKRAEAQTFTRQSFRRQMSEEFLTLNEVQQMVQKSVGDAKAQGAREAEQKLKPAIQETVQKVNSVLDEFSRFRRELFKEAELEVLDLIGRVAKRVVGAELSLKPELLKNMVEKAIEGLTAEKKIVVSFNPQDQAQFQSFHPEFLKELSQKPELEFRPESQIPAGLVWIRTETVELEVNADKMVDEVLSQLLGSVKSAKETGDEEDKV